MGGSLESLDDHYKGDPNLRGWWISRRKCSVHVWPHVSAPCGAGRNSLRAFQNVFDRRLTRRRSRDMGAARWLLRKASHGCPRPPWLVTRTALQR